MGGGRRPMNIVCALLLVHSVYLCSAREILSIPSVPAAGNFTMQKFPDEKSPNKSRWVSQAPGMYATNNALYLRSLCSVGTVNQGSLQDLRAYLGDNITKYTWADLHHFFQDGEHVTLLAQGFSVLKPNPGDKDHVKVFRDRADVMLSHPGNSTAIVLRFEMTSDWHTILGGCDGAYSWIPTSTRTVQLSSAPRDAHAAQWVSSTGTLGIPQFISGAVMVTGSGLSLLHTPDKHSSTQRSDIPLRDADSRVLSLSTSYTPANPLARQLDARHVYVARNNSQGFGEFVTVHINSTLHQQSQMNVGVSSLPHTVHVAALNADSAAKSVFFAKAADKHRVATLYHSKGSTVSPRAVRFLPSETWTSSSGSDRKRYYVGSGGTMGAAEFATLHAFDGTNYVRWAFSSGKPLSIIGYDIYAPRENTVFPVVQWISQSGAGHLYAYHSRDLHPETVAAAPLIRKNRRDRKRSTPLCNIAEAEPCSDEWPGGLCPGMPSSSCDRSTTLKHEACCNINLSTLRQECSMCENLGSVGDFVCRPCASADGCQQAPEFMCQRQ